MFDIIHISICNSSKGVLIRYEELPFPETEIHILLIISRTAHRRDMEPALL